MLLLIFPPFPELCRERKSKKCDALPEWLRGQIANLLHSVRVGSNLTGIESAFLFFFSDLFLFILFHFKI